MFDASFCCHDKQSCILFNGWKDGFFVEMDEIQAMAFATSVALLSIKRKDVVAFQSELFDAGVATESGEFGVLH